MAYTPTANTLVYYQFNNNLNDSSGNGRNLSLARGAVTYGTAPGGAKYSYWDNSTVSNYVEATVNYAGPGTVSFWTNSPSNGGGGVLDFWKSGNGYLRVWIAGVSCDFTYDFLPSYTINKDEWYYVTILRDNALVHMYINGVYAGQGTPKQPSGTYSTRLRFNAPGDQTATSWAGNFYISEFIWENRTWTSSEIQNYYANTKAGYEEPQPQSKIYVGSTNIGSGKIWYGNANPTAVYLGSTKVRPAEPLDPFVYYTTTANTLAYRPLSETKVYSDLSGNHNDMTSSETQAWNNNMYLNAGAGAFWSTSVLPRSGDFTISYWCYPSSYNNMAETTSGGPNRYLCNMSGEYTGNFNTPSNGWKRLGGTSSFSGPVNFTVTRSGSTITLYVNGSQTATLSFSYTIPQNTAGGYIYGFSSGISNVIIENTAWSSSKVSDWYNASKVNYGI